MIEIKERINKRLGASILTSIIFLLVGALLIINPDTFIASISYILGGVLIVNGVWTAIKYINDKGEKSLVNFSLIYAIICAIAGLLLVLNPNAIATILIYVVGFWMIVNSVIKIQMALNLKSNKIEHWQLPLLMSIFTLILAIFLILKPIDFAEAITQVIGIFVVVYSIIDIAEYITIKKTMKEFDKIIDATIVSEKDN